MKSLFKVLMLGIITLCSLMVVTLSVYADKVESDNCVWDKCEDGTYMIQAYFNPSHKIQEGEGYGLESGKNVKQAYVRVKSKGLKLLFRICGSYDSGRLYSKAASYKWIDKIIATPKGEVKNCSTCVQELYYDWIYFE